MLRNTLLLALSLLPMVTFAVSSNTTSSEEVAFSNKYQDLLANQAEVKTSPYKLIQSVGEQVFSSVSTAKKSESDVVKAMETIVENQLMPYIDVTFASYKILGSQVKKSSKEERKMFVQAMQKNLVKTYSNALAQYTDQRIVYEPERNIGNKKTVQVKTELINEGQKPINMVFKLRKNRKTGQWKAYDLVVEGISLVDSKRAELSNPLRTNGIKHVAENVLN